MLSLELQPAVRQIVQRNGELEEENKRLYATVHQFLTEVTALRAVRAQYESLVAGQPAQVLSPTQESLRATAERQRRQIARLQGQLDATAADLSSQSAERADLEQRCERCADALERSAQLEADAGQACNSATRQLLALCALCGGEEEDAGDAPDGAAPAALPGALQALHRAVEALGGRLAAGAAGRRALGEALHAARQAASELGARVRALETEKAAADECGARYEQERQQLGNAFATLRASLEAVKARLVAAEGDRKRLAAENARLRLARERG
jgi:chromosome segregation ATPase